MLKRKRNKNRQRIIAIALVLAMVLSVSIPGVGIVENVEAATTKLNKTNVVIKIGQRSKLILSGAVKEQITWESKSESIATVTRTGRVDGINAGTTVVTATYKTKKYSCKVTVLPVTLSKKSVRLMIGENVSLVLNNAYGDIKWSSADKSVAKVASNGRVEGFKAGKTTISATNQGKVYTCSVTVDSKETINVKINSAIDALILTAQKEIGYKEKRSNKNLDKKNANAGYGNYTKYSRDVDSYYQGQPWCAIFVSWCMKETYGLKTAKNLLKDWPYVACRFLPAYLPTYRTPKRGDIVIFHDGIDYNHTGIVTRVEGTKFWTIEGNAKHKGEIVPNGYGYCVCEKSYNLSSSSGIRFCRPDYSLCVRG